MCSVELQSPLLCHWINVRCILFLSAAVPSAFGWCVKLPDTLSWFQSKKKKKNSAPRTTANFNSLPLFLFLPESDPGWHSPAGLLQPGHFKRDHRQRGGRLPHRHPGQHHKCSRHQGPDTAGQPQRWGLRKKWSCVPVITKFIIAHTHWMHCPDSKRWKTIGFYKLP